MTPSRDADCWLHPGRKLLCVHSDSSVSGFQETAAVSFFFTPIMSLSDFILSSEFISALGRRVEDGSWDELAGKPSLQPSCIDTIHIIYFTPPPTPFFMFRHLYATVIFTFCLTVLLVLISITMSERRGVSGGVVACALRFFHS